MDRRSFLKLAFLSSASMLVPQMEIIKPYQPQGNSNKPNILILLFDAWSASNISLYGYPRETTPNLHRLAQKATVYHNHHSPANFTGPSTVSLLSGVYPWKHHGFQGFNGSPPEYINQNLFSSLQGYTRMAYSQNPIPNRTFAQMSRHIEDFTIPHNTTIMDHSWVDDLFHNDLGIAMKSELEILGAKPRDKPNSLFSSLIHRYIRNDQGRDLQKIIRKEFPKGPVAIGFMKFILEDTMAWSVQKLADLNNPFFAYLHFFPPHDPYRPRKEFIGLFDDDGWTPIDKPIHKLGGNKTTEFLNEDRALYDSYITYIDHEIGRMFDILDKAGILDNTMVILTSDHGESFERGVHRHQTSTLFEPVIHVPLMIFEPGQTSRKDIYYNTSTLDLLPTITYWAGAKPLDAWEGDLLPPYHSNLSALSGRFTFAMDSRVGSRTQPPKKASFAVFHESYKLIHYYGFGNRIGTDYELFDLEADPEEINNLYSGVNPIAAKMKEYLYQQIEESGSIYV